MFLNRLIHKLRHPYLSISHYITGRLGSHFIHSCDKVLRYAKSVIIKLPAFKGEFEIDSRSDILKRALWTSHYEPTLSELFSRKLDSKRDVIDIGANIGFFSVLASKSIESGQRVLAVEPTPSALRYLKSNLTRNDCLNNTIIFEGVATETDGEAEINWIPGMEEYSSIGKITYHEDLSTQKNTVEACKIDTLVERFGLIPGFIKIDVEGAELLALRGAVHTLRVHRPVILSELADTHLATLGHRSTEVLDLLESNGYRVFDADHPENPVIYPYSGNILAIPETKA